MNRSVRTLTLVLAAVAAAYAFVTLAVLLLSSAPILSDAVFNGAGLGPLAVGTLLVVHRPAHRLGQLLLAVGVAWSLGEAARVHLWLGLHLGDLPGLDLAAWLLSWVFVPGWLAIPFLLAMFPTGRVESAWMRIPARITLGAVALFVVTGWLVPQDLGAYGPYLEGVTNPWAVDGLAAFASSPVAGVLEVLATGTVVVFAVAAVVDLAVRWSRSDGTARLQMRWFGTGVVVAITLLVGGAIAAGVGDQGTPLLEVISVVVAVNAPAAAIGVAVARYRLLEIDRLISRTATYLAIAVVLAGVYAAGVLILGSVLPSQGELSVAASTLAVAALFSPLRRGVRRRLDRRFNRSRYDAELELGRFADRLRDELDLDGLVDDLGAVVRTTVQPSAVTVWLPRDPTAGQPVAPAAAPGPRASTP